MTFAPKYAIISIGGKEQRILNMRISNKSIDYEQRLKEYLAKKYDLPCADYVNLDKAAKYKEYLTVSSQELVNRMLDDFDTRRARKSIRW